MATLVFECLDAGGLPDGARRIEIVVAPGISAMQAPRRGPARRSAMISAPSRFPTF